MLSVSVHQLKSDPNVLKDLQDRAASVQHETDFHAITWLVEQFSGPISEEDFREAYHDVIGRPFQAEDFPPYCDFVEVIASIPGIFRQKDEDSDAVFLCSAKHSAKLDREMAYQEPSWALNCEQESLPIIFLKTKWTIRVFKDEEQIDFMDLKSFIGPFGEVPSSYIIFGRGENVDYLMCHPSISRVHGVLQFDHNGNLFIYDMSTHGTFVRGKRIEREKYVQLKTYDTIKFGQSSREYVLNISRDRSYVAPPSINSRTELARSAMSNLSANGAARVDLDVDAEEKHPTKFPATVGEIQTRLSEMTLDDEENVAMMDVDDEEAARVFVVEDIDFRKYVDDLGQLRVADLKLYTSANDIALPSKIRKTELIGLIRADIQQFI